VHFCIPKREMLYSKQTNENLIILFLNPFCTHSFAFTLRTMALPWPWLFSLAGWLDTVACRLVWRISNTSKDSGNRHLIKGRKELSLFWWMALGGPRLVRRYYEYTTNSIFITLIIN
jgi:hypothetical protein